MAVNRYYSSTAPEVTLAGGITSSSLTMNVTSASGYPIQTPFTVVIDKDTESEEIVTVTAVSGTAPATLTITRGEDGSSATAHATGAKIRHSITARDLREPQEHIAASTDVHGVTGALVGTATSQTLTNKTISGSSNTLSNIPQSSVTGLSTALSTLTTSIANVGSSLATVATTGVYSDLTGKPTIPTTAAQVGAVPTTRTVNSKALSSDITLTNSDVGAAATVHTHDDRYFTEAEADGRFAPLSHNHDSRYYTETEINAKIPGSGRAVNDVSLTNTIGLRWSGDHPIFKVDDTEFTLPLKTETDALSTSKANAQGDVNTAPRADGSDRPFEASSGPGSYYAVWVDADHNFFRNTSSEKYKQNVRPHEIDPASVLALQPVIFDRRDGSQHDEFGLIAERVNEHIPEIVQLLDGEVDGIRYDLLSVALLSVVKDLAARVAVLEGA